MGKLKRMMLAAAAAVAILPAFAEKRPMALVIMTDGLRASSPSSSRTRELQPTDTTRRMK